MSRSAAICVSVAFCLLAWQRSAEAQAPGPGRPGIPAEARTHARTRGSVRVIVRLDVAFSNEAALGAARASSQRASIAASQTSVLRRLFRASAARRFAYIPYLALEIDETDLTTLASLPEVTEIRIDRLAAPTLSESSSIIEADLARMEGYRGAGWAVAVLDTGVDRAHPFLAGKVISEACYSTTVPGYSTSVCPGGVESSVAPGAGAPCTGSSCEHGTHVAGIVAGSGGGMFGVAPAASLISIQIFSSFTTECGAGPIPCIRSFESDQIAGLERIYALRSTYSIAAVNLSLGSRLFTSPCDGEPSKAIIDQLRAAGIATIVASGNDGSATALASPSCISSAISVGATTDGSSGHGPDQVSSFTNSNQYLTLLAPGETITSSIPGGGFASFNGTSMAAPHVAGAWAVMKSRRPAATVSEVAAALVSTGVGVFDPANGLTKPRIRLRAALQRLPAPCTYDVAPTRISVPPSGGSVSITLTTAAGCPWSTWDGSEFVTIASGATGTGPATIVLSVSPNLSRSPRSGVITVAGVAVVIDQIGATAGDVGGDGRADLIWQHATSGSLAAWYLDGHEVKATVRLSIDRVSDVNWKIAGSGDLNGDGATDLVWQHELSGRLAVWYLSGAQVVSTLPLSIDRVDDTNWQIRGVGDTNGDGFADLIWQHRTAGWLAVWFMRGAQVLQTQHLSINRVADTNWHIAAAGDMEGNGIADIVWQHQTSGDLAVWYLEGARVTRTASLSVDLGADPAWKIRGVGDTSGDGLADLLWHNESTGALGVWYMAGEWVAEQWSLSIDRVADTGWRIVGPG